MKPDELKPTRAALHDDDGRSAMRTQTGYLRRRQDGYAPLFGRKMAPDAEPLTTLERSRRYQQRHKEARARQAKERYQRYKQQPVCMRCRVVHVSRPTRLCPMCSAAAREERWSRQRAKKELQLPYRGGRSLEHEHRVKLLHYEQGRMPL